MTTKKYKNKDSVQKKNNSKTFGSVVSNAHSKEQWRSFPTGVGGGGSLYN
jgi:hypothetical protein